MMTKNVAFWNNLALHFCIRNLKNLSTFDEGLTCKIQEFIRFFRSGGNIEVMGLLLGKVDANVMVVMDCFALPVEGTETRVNVQSEGFEYMTAYVESAKRVGRLEHVLGWYHSHPGYGCWLSGKFMFFSRLSAFRHLFSNSSNYIKTWCRNFNRSSRRKRDMTSNPIFIILVVVFFAFS